MRAKSLRQYIFLLIVIIALLLVAKNIFSSSKASNHNEANNNDKQIIMMNPQEFEKNKNLVHKHQEEHLHLHGKINENEQHLKIFNKIFDLTKPLIDDHKKIDCRLSKPINNIITTLCVHDLNSDSFVSAAIWNDGVWEADIVTNVLNSLEKYKDSLFLDIGAQVGQYSLYAAKLGHKVLTVEPFHDNIMRIHKAAFNQSLGNKITLITNAISNKRGEIKLLKNELRNIGGQSLIEHKNRVFTKNDIKPNDPNAKYFVETILFDDIVHNMPLKDDGNHHTTAVMKIDIESFEPYAFQYATRLFDTIDIKVIFMEWGNLPKHLDMVREIENMIDFLLIRNYTPYNLETKLNKADWKTGWGWDIIWRKNA